MYHKLFRDALHPWKQCIAKGCISVYWRAGGRHDWTGFNSAKLLSSTANISVAIVDSSPLKLMHKLWRDALCFHVSVDGYLWSRFNSAELSTVAILTAPYGGIWQVELKKTDNNIWFCNGWQDFVEYHFICYDYFLVFRYEGNLSFHVLIFDKTATEILYPPSKNCKLEDHQVEIIDLDEDDTNISFRWFAHKTWSQRKVCYEKFFLYIKRKREWVVSLV